MEFFALFVIFFQIYLIFTVIVLLLDNRHPAETFAWIFIFILLPGIGFIIYFLVGHNWKKSYDHQRKIPQFAAKNFVSLFKPLNDLQEETIKNLKSKSLVYQDDLMTLLYRNSRALLTMDNKVEFFHNGKDKFDRLIEDLKGAKEYIHMEYFIWRSDALGERIKKVLIEKAREGVEVRLLYDYSGSLITISRAYIKELRKEGIQIYPFFNYLSIFKLHTINYRNHRKIVVIDGKIGYTGGMNIGQEYIDGGKRFQVWRDTHLRLEGESVSMLEAIWAIDWYNTTSQEEIFDAKYFPLISDKGPALKGNLAVQLPTSGFDSSWPSILHLYFTLITMAQKSIYIVSPYFIPDTSLLMALKTAGMRGIKVTIVMMGIPDNPLPYWAAFSYCEELLKAGVKIFHYQKGFMHAKIFSSDGRICTVGTANLDIRSLKLNYEINAVFYDEETTKTIDAQILEDLKSCKEITLVDLNQKSISVKLRNSLARLISPLL